MKVLLINGSPKKDGNTAFALKQITDVFDACPDIEEYEVFQVGKSDIRGCIACNFCRKEGRCVFDDCVNKLAPKFETADGMVIASPVYYASPNGTVLSLLDRLFYSTPFDKAMKVGASVAVARRGGLSSTFDILNKYFTISQMPIASSRYWNSVHGQLPGEAKEDEEGLQTMRLLAKNMIFLMKSIALGKEQYGLPGKEDLTAWTNFVR